jgi:hypothetical protein
MAAAVAQFVPKNAQAAFVDYHKYASTTTDRHWNLREKMRQIDLAYLREQDLTEEQFRAKISNRAGDANRIQNITIPIIRPQVASAVAYQAAIFLTDYPIFGVVSSPEYIDQALQFQAVLEENSIRGAWARELMLFFYDGFKYDLSAVECKWDKVVTAALDTDISYKGGAEGRPKEVIWAGNCLKRWDPYNTYFDTRCLPYDIPAKGEFCGHTELYSRTALKTYINSLETKLLENIIPAFESPSMMNIAGGGDVSAAYHMPILNYDSLMSPDSMGTTDWDNWMGNSTRRKTGANINYRGLYELSTEYVRVIPSDFDLKVPAPNTPQVWKLIFVNHSVLIYAERQTNAHEKIPVFFGCPSEDGLGYQTKSLASNGIPFQQSASALMNATLAGRRRAVTDRVLYDPSRVSEGHMNSPNPSAKIPVRPSAYGKPVSESVYPFPYRDDQAGMNMQEIQQIIQLGNLLNGQNPARQGQFVKGNKTDGQWETTMQSATSNDQLTALLYEAQVFTPLKEVLKLNTLQYQGASSIYSPSQEQTVTVDPIALRRAVLNFKVTDGLLPRDKLIAGDVLQTALQAMAQIPGLAGAYNIAPMFSYLVKAHRADIRAFEKSPAQMAYEQALGQWNQLAQLAIEKGTPFTTPQPIPQQYGYTPPDSEGAGDQKTGAEETSEGAQQ